MCRWHQVMVASSLGKGIRTNTITDPEALAQLKDMPEHETVVLVPRTLLLEYARMIFQDEQPA